MDEFIKYMQLIQEENEKNKQNLITTKKRLEMLLNDTNQKIDNLRTIQMETGEALGKIIEKQIEDFTKVALSTPSLSTLVKQETDNNMLTEETQKMLQESILQMESIETSKESLKSKPNDASDEKNFSFDNQKKKSIEKSVKPGVKVKNKQKTRKMDWAKAKRNIVKFVGACVVVTSVGIIVGMHADDIYANHLRSEALETYTESVYIPNTHKEWIYSDSGNRQIYVHDWRTLIEQTQNVYENPIVGFYMLYTKLDQESKKNYMNTFMAEFNLYYGTDYKDVEDVLTKNNFKDFKALSKYVSFEIYRMGAEEVSVYDEGQDSTVRR